METKIELLKRVTGFKEVTVCEDEDRAYEYWEEHVNHNKEDCCNLRRGNGITSGIHQDR